MEAMRILIIGLGSIGTRHARNALAMGHEVLAVDPRYTSPGPVSSASDAPWCSRTPEEAYESLRPDAVVVASPPALHFEHASQAIIRGIPTFVEKPLTIDHAEAEVLVSLAQVNGVTLATGFMLRALPQLRGIRLATTNESLLSARFWCHWESKAKTYEWPGVLAETAHELDAAQWLYGPLRDVRVTTLEPYVADIWLHTQEGHEVNLYLTADGRYNYSRGIQMFGTFDCLAQYGQKDIEPCYVEELKAFLDGTPLATGEDGLAAVRLAAQIEAAAKVQT
jgi:predicted dehydrogenase